MPVRLKQKCVAVQENESLGTNRNEAAIGIRLQPLASLSPFLIHGTAHPGRAASATPAKNEWSINGTSSSRTSMVELRPPQLLNYQFDSPRIMSEAG
mmetsp:Transcript_46827/g.141850  ORF Transcript_46827/g.141850 Transcript_46827/m.141850 type:complete len:97 (-) Transcript_46827:42-332(-)